MTNREWLNTLSDEEFANELCNMRMFCVTELKNQMGVIRGGAESIDWLKWLQAEHETTADEDFAEIGFNKNAERQAWIEYESGVGKKYTMFKDGTEFFESGVFKGSLIDQIRTIADKKRKELGWNE